MDYDPLPLEIITDALQDTIHKEFGQTRQRVMPFRTFLMSFKDEDSPLGDLAQDTIGSNWKGSDPESLYHHMYDLGACSHAFDAFEELKEKYYQLGGKNSLT
jgi:hypothetical protein